MNRKYKLLKKWPDSEIGDIYQWNGQGYSNQTRVSMVISKNYVEKFPDWFEEVTDTERTEVIKIEYLAKDIIGKKHIDIKLSSCIYEDQFPAIKKAIEKVLNPEPIEENKEQSKDWEIVSGCAKNGDIHEWYNDNSHGGESCWQQKCKIRSVRRLSDNKIFTVGDKTKIGFIKKFELKGGKMYWWNEHTWYYMFQLEFSLPEPQPLFVTEPMKESDIISPPQKLIINGIEYHQSKQ